MLKIKSYELSALVMTLVITLIISFSSTAFASTLSTIKASNNKEHFSKSVFAGIRIVTKTQENRVFEKGTNGIKIKLHRLVKSGILTQTQEKAVVKLATTNSNNYDIKTGLDSLITAGTINKSQENAIIKLFSPSKNETFVKRANAMK